MSETPLNPDHLFTSAQPPISETPAISHTVERKPLSLQFTPNDKAGTFCQIMCHQDAPASFNTKVLKRLKRWGLLAEDIDPAVVVGNYEEFRKLMWQAKAAAEKGSLKFIEAFNTDPWNFDGCVEGEYAEAELADKFPIAASLQTALQDEQLRFLFRAEPGEFYLRLVTREDGKRQVIRMVDTDRTIEEINADAQRAPSIIPKFEAVRLQDDRTALLIQWADGHMPSTPEEIALCLTHAEELLGVPIDSYDLWAGNFLVSEEVDPTTKEPKVFYIDRDIPETIAQRGYGEVTDERRKIFEQGKEKME